MSSHGPATIRRDGGRLVVEHADDVIGISFELLAEQVGWGLYVDGDGLIWLAGDPDYRHRPVRFEASVGGLAPGEAVEGARVLICERVR